MENKILSPLKSIRANCIDCMCGSKKEVRLCPSVDCPLFPYRLGRYPEGARKKRKLSQERKDELREQLSKANGNKSSNPAKFSA